jgi:hypothetical protein
MTTSQSLFASTEARMLLQFERMRFAAERLVSSSRSQIETEAAALLRHGSFSAGLSVPVCRVR